jgi:hypothetical protein
LLRMGSAWARCKLLLSGKQTGQPDHEPARPVSADS